MTGRRGSRRARATGAQPKGRILGTGMVVRRLPLGRRRPPRTAFVLGGGGNLGSMQVGMLRALVERDIIPDLVLGCSVGAINGAGFAHDPTLSGVARLEEDWRSVTTEQICPSSRLAGPWSLLKKGDALYPNDGVRKMIEDGVPARTFEDLTLPFQCVATSLSEEREVWFQSGELIEPILASAALPGVFPPVVIHGVRYIDGGIVDNVPVQRAFDLGAERLFVLHVGNFRRPRPEPKRPIDILLQAFSIGRSYRFHLDMTRVPESVEVVVLPAVAPSQKLRYDDFDHCADLIGPAYLAAASYLDRRAEISG